MKSDHDILREHFLGTVPTLAERRETEWSPSFEKLMRNRLIMGSYRYGLLHAPKPKWDRIASIRRRLDRYEQTGNTEHLVDVANLCLLEYEEGLHPNKHFSSSDDGEHVHELQTD